MDLGWHAGDVVRKFRERRRWTQKKLATAARVNKATIVSVEENAAGTKRETYEKIAKALGMKLGDLFSLIPGESQGPQATRSSGEPFREWDGQQERRSGTDRRVADGS